MKKILLVLAGIAIAIIAVCKSTLGQEKTVENFWGIGSRKWKTIPVVKQGSGSNCHFAAAGGNFLGPLNDDRFVKYPNFQGILAPRFSNVDYGANIRYNMADYKNTAVPCNPLTFGDMAQENYQEPTKENFSTCSTGCTPSCGKGGMPVPYQGGAPPVSPGFASGNYNQMTNSAYDSSAYPEATDTLPVGNMTSMDADGNVTQPVVYQQFIFANQRSRLRAQGDPIRGDLPITPCEGNWFSVHPNVNLDLQEGAMNVMGGISNDTNRALTHLINQTAGETAIGGINLADVDMTPQYTGNYSAAFRDINVVGLP